MRPIDDLLEPEDRVAPPPSGDGSPVEIKKSRAGRNLLILAGVVAALIVLGLIL